MVIDEAGLDLVLGERPVLVAVEELEELLRLLALAARDNVSYDQLRSVTIRCYQLQLVTISTWKASFPPVTTSYNQYLEGLPPRGKPLLLP